MSLSVKNGLNHRQRLIRPLRNFFWRFILERRRNRQTVITSLNLAWKGDRKFQRMPLYFSAECRQLFFRADFTLGNRRLIKHVIESIDVRDFDLCELHCYHQPKCVSINFFFRERKGLHKCELNNATHLSHGWDLKNIYGYIYKGTEVRTLNLLPFKSIFWDFSCIRIDTRVPIQVRFVFKFQLKFASFSCSRSDSHSFRTDVRVPIHDC